MRKLDSVVIASTVLVFAVLSAPVQARTIHIGTSLSRADVKSACANMDGNFHDFPDGSYGCFLPNGHVILCKAGKCDVDVPDTIVLPPKPTLGDLLGVPGVKIGPPTR